MTTVRRTLILAVLLVAAGSLIFTTGAAVIDGEADTLADDRVAIQPADSPNGDYAYLNDDDEIVVDVSASNPNLSAEFEGINVGSTGRISDVFTITYTANETADVWIEHEGENVTFVTEDGPVETESNAVTLGPNGSVSVGIQFDTRGAEPNTRLGADEFAIHANVTDPDSEQNASSTASEPSATAAGGADAPEATPSVTVSRPTPSERSLEATDIDPSDAVGFDLGRTQLSGTNVTLDHLELRGVSAEAVNMKTTGSPTPFADGGELDAAQRPVPMGYLSVAHDVDSASVDQMRLRFSVDRDHLGETDPANLAVFRQTDAGGWESRETAVLDAATVDRRGLDPDRVHVVATTDDLSTFAVATHTARIGVQEAALADADVTAGTETTVTATVENAGGAAGERTLTLTADGEPADATTVTLEPGASTTVTFSVAFETAGTYDLAVAGAPAGELLVGEEPAPTETTSAGASETESGADEPDSAGDDGSSPDAPTEEPGGVGLSELGGLAGLLAAVVVVLALARRRPWS